jgi:hypothetical protein
MAAELIAESNSVVGFDAALRGVASGDEGIEARCATSSPVSTTAGCGLANAVLGDRHRRVMSPWTLRNHADHSATEASVDESATSTEHWVDRSLPRAIAWPRCTSPPPSTTRTSPSICTSRIPHVCTTKLRG